MRLNEQQKEDAALYSERVAEIARNARAVKAAPASPRQDEWTDVEKPTEERSGDSYISTGPEPQTNTAPVPGNGKWVTTVDGSRKFSLNQTARKLKPAEPKPVHIIERPAHVQGHLQGTSGIGAITLPGAAAPCGPPGTIWVDPKKR